MEPGPIRILLVEDQGDIAEMYRLRLELDGFKVAIASTGQQALELASTGWPDVVLLDLRLPDIDGFAVMNRLHSEKESALMSVIVLTDEDDQEMISRAFELGALDFLRMSRVTPDAVSLRIKTWAHTPHNTSAA
ncbi:MAG: response regulator [Chloroflexi bacterium]|nr:MAG: response regulator [Chloroflexota bacterium]